MLPGGFRLLLQVLYYRMNEQLEVETNVDQPEIEVNDLEVAAGGQLASYAWVNREDGRSRHTHRPGHGVGVGRLRGKGKGNAECEAVNASHTLRILSAACGFAALAITISSSFAAADRKEPLPAELGEVKVSRMKTPACPSIGRSSTPTAARSRWASFSTASGRSS